MRNEIAIAMLVLTLMVSGPVFGQISTSGSADPHVYKTIPAEEDWSFLTDPALRSDFWDPIKYISLRNGAKDWYLSIGGQIRQEWETGRQRQLGSAITLRQPVSPRAVTCFIWTRTTASTFVPSSISESGICTGRIGGPRPIDEKRLDLASAFLEIRTGPGEDSDLLRVGRQELRYGSGRLIDVREGPNVRLSFAGAVGKERLRTWRIDEIAVRPMADNPRFFDNAPIHGESLWGVYATHTLPRRFGVDRYYLGLDRDKAAVERGVGHEARHSVGARLFRPVALDEPAWDFDFEGVEQFGTFASANIEAWTSASDTGYRIPTIPLKPRLSLKADVSSGDNPGSKTMGSFNPLFPTGYFFGVLADTGPGPINFMDLHPKIETGLPHGISWSADWVFQWRENINDGVYNIAGFLIAAANGSRARYVGDRPGTEVHWQATRHLWFQADYGIFLAGRFLKEAGPGKNLNYSALYVGYRF